ncbi:aminotransferase class I/II-fold pyridoxal phosphate-dependent enzyme [Sinorhizobium meliloti]|nr:aminotransferase class I/II-fold pyridoxal phosphate-dependent enzyme [Sinorhizobium meliloti]MDW9509464.1 aminotransferase class I/II-fold pyridoxal phosphate-dependent enzyme [Sinorhizobium meliloti]MDX0772240.1 aminotransferase class I/II-fold pyridoxal phosphate-dependent enzyme [Sinorhizobium medicae]MDX0906712.1 aminotransferase class I/II-fold pyridoxal phosphate-dependent enzyme [Sinorhizobium medicae]MDX1164206.1 aminotransferase class I/II-fold pyridoxal phosphate-dependent enzyme 
MMSGFFEGTALDYFDAGSVDLQSRWDAVADWWNARLEAGIDPYQKITSDRISPLVKGSYRDGKVFSGLNFASQEYLSLASHPEIVEAAIYAARHYGCHSAGSATLMGNTDLSVQLERRLAEYLGYKDCLVFPIGWAAGYGALKTLVRKHDHVVIDTLAHACLQEGAAEATPNVHRFPHLSTDGVERRLRAIRATDTRCGILVVTETLFSMDSDTPDVRPLVRLCREYDATLLVDAAHDLGVYGAGGRGILEEQGILNQVDVIVGSFSKAFASTGGFVVTNSRGFRFGLRGGCGPSTFTNAMTPVQSAVVLAALDIVESPEGDERRARVLRNADMLRSGLAEAGFKVIGRASPIVPVLLGDAHVARLMTKFSIEMGGIVNLVEHPAVSANRCRWRLQVMADHRERQIVEFVEIARRSRERALEEASILSTSILSTANDRVAS